MDSESLFLKGNQSIVAALGHNPPSLEEEVDLARLDGPQATSTVGVKKSRNDVVEDYLKRAVDEPESYLLTQVPCLMDMTPNTLQSQLSSNTIESVKSVGSSSLIDVDAMNSLSTSRFLVDHTRLQQYQIGVLQHVASKSGANNPDQVPSNINLSVDEYDNESTTSEFTEQELEDLQEELSEHEDPDLSQGEDEQCGVGLAAQYLSSSPEILRSGSPFSKMISQTPLRDEGIPLCFLQPQMPIVQYSQTSEMDSVFKHPDLTQDEDVVRQSAVINMEFDRAQISASSTMQCDTLGDKSKLLSTSCNTIGSLGEFVQDDIPEDGVCDPSEDRIKDWLETDQQQYTSMFDNECFQEVDLDFLNEEEAENAKQNIFIEEESCTAATDVDDSCFSGVQDVSVIIVRPSWITNSEKELLGPDNIMNINDFLRMRSGALGSLGDGDGVERPDFGLGDVHSPPCAKPKPLMELSQVDDMGQSFFLPDNAMEVEASQKFQEKPIIPSHASGMSSQYSDTTFEVSSRSNASGAIPKTKSNETVHKIAASVATHENSLEGKLDEDRIRSLISGVLSGGTVKSVLDKILKSTVKEDDLHKTTDICDLEASTEVLELRARREAMMKPDCISQETKGKENRSTSRSYEKSSTRHPLQPSLQFDSNERNKPIHKQMERLQVQRTGSVPVNVFGEGSSTQQVDLMMDESVRGIQYQSRILEDTQRSQLTSFHDSSNSGFDSSTPCAPRNHTKKSNKHPPVSKAVNQLYVEDKRPPINTKTAQRPLPRMGLASSLAQIPGARNVQDTRDFTSRSETTLYPNSDGITSFNSTDGDAMRSSSMPSGLQGLGVNSSSRPVSALGHHPQAHKQHHTHKNLSGEDKIVFPQNIFFSNQCVLGMASDVAVTFHNPKLHWVQISIRLMQETVNNTQMSTSGLIFKPSYFVKPKNTIEIKFGLCSQHAGSWMAVLEVKVSDISKENNKAMSSSTSIHTVFVKAEIEEPSVQLSCEGATELIDFGIVPENCIVSREIAVINQSPQVIPAILTLKQVAATAPVFFWNEDNGEHCQVISPTHMAFELPSGDSDVGPVPQIVKIFMKAPHLNGVKVNESGIFEVSSHMQVELDTPGQSTIIISSLPIKAFIGAVHLQSFNNSEPLLMESKSNKCSAISVPLKNNSTFPLCLSLELSNYKDLFTVHPNTLVIQPHSLASANVSFSPKGKSGVVTSDLLVCVEPKGKLYQISITGKSTPVTAELMPAAVPLHRTRSSPVQEYTPKLESTKSRLVFGTVAVGAQQWKKIVLRNTSVSQPLSLDLGIIGSKDFHISKLGSTDVLKKLSIVLDPCEQFSLSVYFCPSSVEAFSSSLICKPRGLEDSVKFTISLQGYGGQSVLHIPDNVDGAPLTIPDISTEQPAMFHTALANTGDREMFLKLRIFSDTNCSHQVLMSDVSVQPEELVIKPKENRDVIIVVNGTPSVFSKIPGCLGFLQIISGDEILRRRFRKLKNKGVKTRRINDPSLLKIEWDIFYSGERDVQTEEISLPLQPEDAELFYNSCSSIKVQLNGEPQPNDDASSTFFACLEPENATNSIADFSLIPYKPNEVNSPPQHQSFKDGRTISEQSATNMKPQGIGWDVFPQTLSIPVSDTASHTFFVVNFTTKQQMLEISSKLQVFNIEPKEAILPSQSSVRVTLRLMPSMIPQPMTSATIDKLQIMCENESRCATITITPPVNSGNDNATGSTDSISIIVTPSTPAEKQHSSNANFAPPVTSHSSILTLNPSSTSYITTNQTSASRTVSDISHQVKSNPKADEKCFIEVLTDNVVYPDTAANKENFVKVKIRNLDTVVHTVKSKVTKQPFAVRHPEFKIKPGHYVSIPVYFKPQVPGSFMAHLKLFVVEENKILSVQLSGMAL